MRKKDWKEGKKEAKKDKEKYTEPKPCKPKVKVLKKGMSEEGAHDFAQKAEDKYMKKIEKARSFSEKSRARTRS